MKRITVILGLSLLSVAFVAASLWVVFSGHRSARAVRTKFRIGGAMLTLSAMISLTSCGGDGGWSVSCYDPAPPPSNSHRWLNHVANSELRNGDVVMLYYRCLFGDEVRVSLLFNNGGMLEELCSQSYTVEEGEQDLEFTIEADDYRGDAVLRVEYVMYDDGNDFFEASDVRVTIVD